MVIINYVNSVHSTYLCELDGDFQNYARDAHDDLRGLRDVPPQREMNPMPSVIFQSVVHKNSRLIIGLEETR